MVHILAGVITFVCTFGGAQLTTFIKSLLPPSHLSKESQNVVQLGMGLVATLSALLLGLVIASAKDSFDAQDAAIRNSAANILTLDRLLAVYGPEARPARDLLREAVAYRLKTTWVRTDPSSPGGFGPGMGTEGVEERILQLAPTTDTQRWLKTKALDLDLELSKTRWRILNSQRAAPTAFLTIVIFWLTVTFASFGLFAPRNATVTTVFFIVSISVAAAVFLILELNSPFDGFIRVSSAPVRFALENLGK
jgi:hypothetical protein